MASNQPVAKHLDLTRVRSSRIGATPKIKSPAGSKPEVARAYKAVSILEYSGTALANAILSKIVAKASNPLLTRVLTAGLCEWTLQPDSDKLVKQTILIEAASMVANLEQRFLRTGNLTRWRDLQRHPSLNPLLVELFYPAGGVSGLVAAYRSAGDRDRLRAVAAQQLSYLVSAVLVLHAYLEEACPGYAENTETHLVEMERLRRAIAQIGFRRSISAMLPNDGPRTKLKKDIKIDMVRKYWRAHARPLAFAYAAFVTPYPKHGNLLAAILSDEVRGSQLSAVAVNWIRRAEYARRAVVEKVDFGNRPAKAQKESGRRQRIDLPKSRFAVAWQVKPLEFPPPKFGAISLKAILDVINAPRGNTGKKLKPRKR